MLEARVPLYAGENAAWGPKAAEKMVGQTTSDGWEVISAERESKQVLWVVIRNPHLHPQVGPLSKGDVSLGKRHK